MIFEILMLDLEKSVKFEKNNNNLGQSAIAAIMFSET